MILKAYLETQRLLRKAVTIHALSIVIQLNPACSGFLFRDSGLQNVRLNRIPKYCRRPVDQLKVKVLGQIVTRLFLEESNPIPHQFIHSLLPEMWNTMKMKKWMARPG
jgi:hypothetical protein